MSHHATPTPGRVTIPQLLHWASEGRRLVMTTAYDAFSAKLADPLVDVLLVGDSVGNVLLGFENTLSVTMAMMLHHVEAVARTGPRSLLVADMPYLSFHLGKEDTLRNAGAFIRAGAAAVKLEGGTKRLDMVHALVDAEIPVMGHLGLTPQSVNMMGGFKVQGRDAAHAIQILEDAHKLQDAGCFSIVLEGIPADLAKRVTETLHIPTIGIGAGLHCTGQVLVLHDLLGLIQGHKPKFVRVYADGYGTLQAALQRWIQDVRDGAFPNADESYTLAEAVRSQVAQWQPGNIPPASPEGP